MLSPVRAYYQAHSACFSTLFNTVLQELEILKLPRYHRHIHMFVLVCSKSCCFVPGRMRLNSVADKPSPCLTPILMPKGVLTFPSTITLAWTPSVIFISRSIFSGITK